LGIFYSLIYNLKMEAENYNWAAWRGEVCLRGGGRERKVKAGNASWGVFRLPKI
jgi:hypothetical protein